jgi:hypothetical protein
MLESDASLDGFSAGWSRALTWLAPAGTLVLAAIYVAAKRAYYWILLEDHPVEWAQFAILVFACLAAAMAAARVTSQRRIALAALLVMVALGCFGMAGEEISWGQRVFSLVPPASVTSMNAQHELNLHNMYVGSFSVDQASQLIELAMGAGGAALAVLTRPRRALFHRTWLWSVAPPLVAVPGFAVMALYQAVMLTTGIGSSPAVLYQEWMEFCFYLSIGLTTACCYTRAAPGRYHRRSGRRTSRRQLDAGVPAGRRPLIVAAVAAFLLMAVFAQMSAESKVLPGNVPPSLISLYGAI